jgi:hypothetical protein
MALIDDDAARPDQNAVDISATASTVWYPERMRGDAGAGARPEPNADRI